MTRMIFVNLPVTDLARSMAFYEAVGARNEPRFTDANAAMMSFTPEINLMLLTHARYRDFTSRPIADLKAVSASLLCITAESREAVDALVEKAKAAGAPADPLPVQEYGMMYGRSFEDPDGQIWEVIWMDPAAAEQGASALEGV